MDSCNKQIISFLQSIPTLYERDPQPFWDDEYISKNMLEAHLNPDFEAASRKMDFIKKSVDWMAQYCNNNTGGKRLLDLGCGPGIYADLLTDKGFQVTGMDYSKRSIAYARQNALEQNKTIEYLYRNYMDLDDTDTYDVIIMVYCDFGVLSPQDRKELLLRIHRALKSGGIFIMDVWNEPYLNDFSETISIHQENGGFWSPKENVVVQRNICYQDTLNTLEEYLIITNEDCKWYHNWNQVYNTNSLTAELRAAGFEAWEFFDDIAGEEYTGSKETLCVATVKENK